LHHLFIVITVLPCKVIAAPGGELNGIGRQGMDIMYPMANQDSILPTSLCACLATVSSSRAPSMSHAQANIAALIHAVDKAEDVHVMAVMKRLVFMLDMVWDPVQTSMGKMLFDRVLI
jgi:hypothetical protein